MFGDLTLGTPFSVPPLWDGDSHLSEERSQVKRTSDSSQERISTFSTLGIMWVQTRSITKHVQYLFYIKVRNAITYYVLTRLFKEVPGKEPSALSAHFTWFRRGVDTIGNPHRAQFFPFDFFELIVSK